jgi:hypothetical protein
VGIIGHESFTHEFQRLNAGIQSVDPFILFVFLVFSFFHSFVIRIGCGSTALCFRDSHWMLALTDFFSPQINLPATNFTWAIIHSEIYCRIGLQRMLAI